MQFPGVLRLLLALLVVPSFVTAAHAEPQPERISLKLLAGNLLPGWKVRPDLTATARDVGAAPVGGPQSELINVSECTVSGTDCDGSCSAEAENKQLWFFANNDPPISRQFVVRTDGLLELRADGRFGESEYWLAVSVLCGTSGMAVVAAQSSMREKAIGYVQAFVESVGWRR